MESKILKHLAKLAEERLGYGVEEGDIYEIEEFLSLENNEIVVERVFKDISDRYDFADELIDYIIKFEGKFYKLSYRNTSYEGLNFIGIVEVEEKQKTVTFYEPLN